MLRNPALGAVAAAALLASLLNICSVPVPTPTASPAPTWSETPAEIFAPASVTATSLAATPTGSETPSPVITATWGATPSESPGAFQSPTPGSGLTPGPIIEVTPLGFPAGLGTLRYQALTNLRNCTDYLVWPDSFDPVARCRLVLRDDGAIEQFPAGAPAWVWSWRIDAYGNRWAWFGSLAAVACLNGQPRGEFYPDVPTWRVAASQDLPAPVSPCDID